MTTQTNPPPAPERPELPEGWQPPFEVMPSSGDSWLVLAANHDPMGEEVVHYSSSQDKADYIAAALNAYAVNAVNVTPAPASGTAERDARMLACGADEIEVTPRPTNPGPVVAGEAKGETK